MTAPVRGARLAVSVYAATCPIFQTQYDSMDQLRLVPKISPSISWDYPGARGKMPIYIEESFCLLNFPAGAAQSMPASLLWHGEFK